MGVSSTNAYAKEMAIRRRMTNIFNKREEDFPSVKEYNDYLEEVEDMTFSLIEGIDVAAIEAKISKYQEENAEQIVNARARKAEELGAALKVSKVGIPLQSDPPDGGMREGAQVNVVGETGLYAPAAAGGMFTQPWPMGSLPQMQPVPVSVSGMQEYAMENEEAQKLRVERGARAGGWTIELSRRRAFEEAFGSMWI